MKQLCPILLIALQPFYTVAQDFMIIEVQVKDQYYYERLDEMERLDYEKELDNLNRAIGFYTDGEYRSALYWAQRTNYVKYEWGGIIYPLITQSYAYLGNKRQARRWFKLLKRFNGDPDIIDKTEGVLDSLGVR